MKTTWIKGLKNSMPRGCGGAGYFTKYNTFQRESAALRGYNFSASPKTPYLIDVR
jgi:hypothetical protein